MERPPTARLRRIAVTATTVLLLLSLCFLPWAKHLRREASLLGDDTQRVEDLQLKPLSALLFRPFNEHLAPVFETVSWIAWQAAGRSVERAAWTFTVASYLPFLLCVIGIGIVARRGFGSWTAAGTVAALFALTPAYAEVVYWYSASSFAWALLACLVAISSAQHAREAQEEGRSGRWASLLTAAATFLSPCGSGIGLLAGPAAAVIGLPGRKQWVRGLGPSLAALAGTAAYLVMAALAKQFTVISQSVDRYGDFTTGLSWAIRAPLYLVATGPLGLRHAELWPAAVGIISLALVLLGLALWIGQGGPWRWIVAGTGLILGGFLLTYPFRVTVFPGPEILRTGRYMLFPHLGLCLILGAAAAPWLKRLDRRRLAGPLTVLGIALVLCLLNKPAIRTRGLYHKYPEQAATLRGIDRLAEVCRRQGVSREQVLANFDPVYLRWNNTGFNTLRLLPETAPLPRVESHEARAAVLSALTEADRLLIFSGMDLTTHGSPDAPKGVTSETTGRLVVASRVRAIGTGGAYQTEGWPSYLEYEFPDGRSATKALRIPSLDAPIEMQVWWMGRDGRWTSTRSVTLRPQAMNELDRVFPTAVIPHWQPGDGRRIRLFFPKTARIVVADPPHVLR
jgi:hypothetical protein